MRALQTVRGEEAPKGCKTSLPETLILTALLAHQQKSVPRMAASTCIGAHGAGTPQKTPSKYASVLQLQLVHTLLSAAVQIRIMQITVWDIADCRNYNL